MNIKRAHLPFLIPGHAPGEDVDMDRRLGDTPTIPYSALTRTRRFRKPWISRSSKACQHRKRLHRTINSVKKLQSVFVEIFER